MEEWLLWEVEIQQGQLQRHEHRLRPTVNPAAVAVVVPETEVSNVTPSLSAAETARPHDNVAPSLASSDDERPSHTLVDSSGNVKLAVYLRERMRHTRRRGSMIAALLRAGAWQSS